MTIATSAVCDFLKENKNATIASLNDGKIARITDYIYAVVDVWMELKKKPNLYDFAKEWIAKDYASVIGIGSEVRVLVGVPNSECKAVVFEY